MRAAIKNDLLINWTSNSGQYSRHFGRSMGRCGSIIVNLSFQYHNNNI